jgi:hypothetical protein
MPEPVRRIEVFTRAGCRRAWSPEEKATIVAESYGEGDPRDQDRRCGPDTQLTSGFPIALSSGGGTQSRRSRS